MKRSLLGTAAALLFLTPLALDGRRTAPAMTPCPTASGQPAGALCGQLTVPENRAIKGGRQIALQIVLLPSKSAGGHADPVFWIAGGPGLSATRLAVSYPRLYEGLQADHDVVLVDQRGTGQSKPLACVTTDFTKAPAALFEEPLDNAALIACRDRLAKDADLTQYTTAAAVEDLEATRAAFGYAKVNVLAVSYGTRVGLEYLRKYDTRVRAAALSGVMSPTFTLGLAGARESQASVQQLFSLCAADAACKTAFPNLATEFTAVLAALDKAPASATIPVGDPPGASITLKLTRTAFTRELFTLLHFREDWSTLPLAIHSAFTKDFMPFAAIALQREFSRLVPSDAMALSVICAQDAPRYTPAAVTAATRGSFLRDDRVKFFARACGVWPGAARVAAATLPVRSNVPVLLISGALDPLTPSSYAAGVAQTLPNSLHVVVANVSHVPANVCVNGLIVGALKTANAKTLDAACAAAMAPIKFVTSI